MTKGLSVIPKPFIKKVTIEKAQNQFINKGDYGADVGLYVDLPKDQAVKLSFVPASAGPRRLGGYGILPRYHQDYFISLDACRKRVYYQRFIRTVSNIY